jgi:hypothetical protein
LETGLIHGRGSRGQFRPGIATETGQTGSHFVVEAAPPKSLKALKALAESACKPAQL